MRRFGSTTFRKRVFVGVAVGIAVGASAGQAVADQPITTVPAAFSDVSSSGGTLLANIDRVESRTAAGALAGHSTLQRYCSPFGEGTSIVGFRMLAGRWHVAHGDDAVIVLHGDAGELARTTDGDLPKNRADNLGPWSGAASAMSPSGCIASQTIVRRRIDAPLLWTSALQEVAIRDDVGPSVSDVETAETGWITGGVATVRFTSRDNQLHRGAVRAQIAGGPIHSLGDVPDGRSDAGLSLAGIADGVHTVTVSRHAWGWTTRSSSTSIRVDRTPPAVPVVVPSVTGWTNAMSVEVRTDPTADATSGWHSNELQVGDAEWVAANGRMIAEEGVHAVRARAVDHAGNRSSASEAAVVRIDRTPPVVGSLRVSGAEPGGAVLEFSLEPDGGSPYTGCPIGVQLSSPSLDWVEVLSVPARDLVGRVRLEVPMAPDAAGPHTVRLTVCDEAGNRTRRTIAFHRVVEPPDRGNAVRVASGSAVSRSALVLRSPGTIAERFGQPLVVRAGVRLGAAAAMGVPVSLVDPSGRTVRIGRTGPGGLVRFRMRATRAGRWTIVAASGGHRAVRRIALRVRPVILVRSRVPAGWGTLRAAIRPAAPGRVVRIQRRTPAGWTTVASVRTGTGGRIAVTRRWVAGSHRVLVPRQARWSLTPAATRFGVSR